MLLVCSLLGRRDAQTHCIQLGQKKRKRAEMKSGSVNGHYTMLQDLHHEHLDHLLAAMRLHVKSQHNARGCAGLFGFL